MVSPMPNTRVVIREFGGPDVLDVVTDDRLPEPQGSQVRVKVLTTSAAFTDVMIRKGLYPDVKARPPFALGYDLVGIVDKPGPDAKRYRPGQRVADLTTIGAYAEYVCLPEAELVPVPEDVDPVEAVSVILSFVTPYQMLHRVAKVTEGQRILVHGAGGAVGTAMLQLARLAHVEAFGTDTITKHDVISELGGVAIDSDPENLEARLKAATGGGVDVVFDALGGESLNRSLHILKPGGMLVAYGFQNMVMGKGGSIPLDFIKLKLWDLLPNGHATSFYAIGSMRRHHPEWFKEDLARMFTLLSQGKIKPLIARTMPLAEARRAHELIEAGEAKGKIVLLVGDQTR